MTNLEQMQRDLWPHTTPQPPVSGLAIASLALGVLTVGPALFAALLGPGGLLTALLYLAVIGVPAVLAIVFGHVALAAVNRGERRGRGMAVSGFTLGYLAFVGPLMYAFLLTLLGMR